MRTPNFRILVVEDDPRMVELLRLGLGEKGYSVATAPSAEEGRRLVNEQAFDAILLDIQLPGSSGYTIAQGLRNLPGRPAIIMLTALNQEDQVVCGLDAGADDYVTKPFSFPELVARISSAARRARLAAANELCFGPFQLDTARRRLLWQRDEIHITRSEYLLLHALVLSRGEVVLRRQLMMAVWGTTGITHGALDTLVNSLREKLGEKHPDLISTVRGRGYALLDESDVQERPSH
jgi:DNA-binding response OmpR family regulator